MLCGRLFCFLRGFLRGFLLVIFGGGFLVGVVCLRRVRLGLFAVLKDARFQQAHKRQIAIPFPVV